LVVEPVLYNKLILYEVSTPSKQYSTESA